MLRVYLISIALATTLMSTVAYSDGGQTGNDLLYQCESADPVERIGCLNYVLGIADGFDFADAIHMLANRSIQGITGICFPEGVTAGQDRAVVIRYLRNHPADLHLASSALIRNAYAQAWPCKQ